MNAQVSEYLVKLLKEKDFTFKQKEIYYNPINGTCLYEDITPTISDVVIWFYEKHKVWISVLCDCGNENLFTYKVFSTNNSEERCLYNGKNYDSPTEAYEKAIEHVLKNLI